MLTIFSVQEELPEVVGYILHKVLKIMLMPWRKAKGKQVVGDNLEYVPNVVLGTSSSQEVEDLLRLIRKSDYKVICHLSQTQSKISILSLLLCSEAHINALMKLLNFAFVP